MKKKQCSPYHRNPRHSSNDCVQRQLMSPKEWCPLARVGKALNHPGVLQAVHVTIVKRDTPLAMRLQAEPSTTSQHQITDYPSERSEN